MVNLQSRLRLAEDVSFQALGADGGSVLLSLASGYLYTCNETTAALVAALDGRRTLAEAVDELEKQFDAPRAQLEADMLAMAGRLVDEKLLAQA
jgi:hypothetical protein